VYKKDAYGKTGIEIALGFANRRVVVYASNGKLAAKLPRNGALGSVARLGTISRLCSGRGTCHVTWVV